MTEGVIVALITTIGVVIAQIIIANKSAKEIFAELDKRSEVQDTRLDAKLEKYQAVTDAKIDGINHEISALTKSVNEHNNYARRLPVLESKVEALEKANSR